MTGCITALQFDMLCDVLQQTIVQDPDSGAITRTWEVTKKDVLCHVESILSANSYGTGGEQWGQMYQNPDWSSMSVETGSTISDRSRIRNVRTRDGGEVLFKEDSGADTVFEVTGIAPQSAPILGHYQDQVLLSRAEVQDA